MTDVRADAARRPAYVPTQRTRRRNVSRQVTSGDGTLDGDPLARVSVHPAAELFPLIDGAEFDELVRDIAEHGQRDPIVFTPDGQLLDGRNRWRACAEAGAVPITRVEQGEPWSYVISTNLHRRHLSESQRAMLAAKVQTRGPGGPRRGVRAEPSIDRSAPTLTDVARMLNVGESSAGRAREVQRKGTPALQHAVESGAVSVYTAARVAKEMPAADQDEFAHRVSNGAKPASIAPPSATHPAPPPPTARSQRKPRYRTVGVAAAEQLVHALDAVGLVLDSALDGLDPSITHEQAGQRSLP